MKFAEHCLLTGTFSTGGGIGGTDFNNAQREIIVKKSLNLTSVVSFLLLLRNLSEIFLLKLTTLGRREFFYNLAIVVLLSLNSVRPEGFCSCSEACRYSSVL